jgi:signal transduction histidine kinase/CheY-like chemotaxis protein
MRPPNGIRESVEAEVHRERVEAAFRQIPAAVIVTGVNASLMAALLVAAELGPGVYPWLALAILVAAARLTLWWAHRGAAPIRREHRFWSLANVFGALAAGLVWGGGSVLLLPDSDVYQLFWIFLIGGMCAGAASLHYPHWPTAAAFIAPAGLPLAIRFALEGPERREIAAAMIGVFLTALLITSRRASRHFGETVRLRHDLAQRTHDLNSTNEELRAEIAEHRATGASLRHAQKMEAVGQLTGAIAHDFNNLLTAVLCSLALLRKRLPAEDKRAERLLETAVQGAERGAALTQRLLAFGRRQALTPEVVDLAALIRGMSTLLGSSLGPGIEVAMRFPEGLPPVEVDANQLELVVLNLAVNARDAMPRGGEMTIGAWEQEVQSHEPAGIPVGDYVVLSVADTGEGMDDATLARAMEPFFTTKGVGKGTGLGLSMVQGFAAQSGGQFLLHSRKGHGTVAELWFPRAKAVPSPAAAHPEPLATQQIRCGTVLVVDDDPLVLASTVAMLEDLGYATVEAKSGREALELQREGRQIDLVITDYAMPGMTGLQLAEELHLVKPLLPVVLATGFSDLQGTVAIGIERLAKPFGARELAEAIDRCLGTVSLRPV